MGGNFTLRILYTMDKVTKPASSLGVRVSRWVDRLLSYPGIDPNYLVRIRTYWVMVVGAAVFVFFLTLLVWALGSRALIWNGITLLVGYSLIAGYIVLAERPVLWIGIVGQIFTIIVTFCTIAILGGLFRSGGIITAAIAAVLFSMFLLRPAWTFFLFGLFSLLLIATPFITPFLAFGADLTPFANTLLYIINTLWITGFMAFFVVTFIRERLRAEEEEARRLKELDSVKTQFYTNISHEFRTPLTVISGMAEQISEHPERWLDEGLDMIRHNSRRILSLVNQMLDLSKLDAGKMPLHMRQADIVAFLRYLSESIRSYAESRHLEFTFEAEVPELVMDYDPGKLTDIVSNLLSNAIKFTPGGGKVSIKVGHDRLAGKGTSQLRIEVADTGPGIPVQHLPYIFDRFFRGEQGEDTAGSGIGLSLTQSLVSLLGGDIHVRSTPGEGSVFTVLLPVANLAPAGESLPLEAEPIRDDQALRRREPGAGNAVDYMQEKPLLLAIDDYPDILEFLKAILSGLYRVETAANGREGLEKALILTPDIIVSDVMMPGMDGMELCRTLKHNPLTSHIPVVLLTARADADAHMEGLENQADAYIAKPFSQAELVLTLRNLTANRKAMRTYYLAAAGLVDKSEAGQGKMAIPQMEEVFLQNLRDIVQEHLDDADFHVEDICRALFMSQSQLHRKMTALTGMGANRFVRSFRLHKSASLLRETTLSITEVAFDTGFRDPEYFGRAFRKMFGMTPSEYREMP